MSGRDLAQKQRATKRQTGTLAELIKKQQPAFAMGLPSFMRDMADQFVRIALTTAKRTRHLDKCDGNSVLGCLQTAAQLGLMPDGITGMSYLIPRKNGRTGRYECNLQLGYKGLLALAYRSQQISGVHLDVVYEKDRFRRMGHHKVLEHEVFEDGYPGEIRNAYAIITTTNGGTISWCVGRHEIKVARESSQTSMVWDAHPEPMWMKTALRAALKYAPQSTELMKAVAIDERADAGLSQNIEDAEILTDIQVPEIADDEPDDAPREEVGT